MKRIDLSGKRFNKWTVIRYKSNRDYECRCECGTIKIVQSNNLKTGASRSCRQCSANAVEIHNKLPIGEGAFNDLLSHYKGSAKLRGLQFDLPKFLVKLILILPCNYCGDKPYSIWPTGKRSDMNGIFVYTGIDRFDSSKGYISTNVVPCCKRCNIAKRNFTECDFIAHAKKIAAYRTEAL